MKSSGGSRRDPADVAPGANHGEDVGAHDDPELRALRAVWLEMRDEEPPGGGLAELLAAARVKAEAMQPRPSWWQRLVAALRRPPVLALATAMVLLAGAAILGRRATRPLSRADEGALHHAVEVGAGSAAQVQLTPAAPAGASPAGAEREGDAAAARAAVLQAEDALRENDAAAARTEAAASDTAVLRTAQANEAALRAAQADEAALRAAQANEAALRAAHTRAEPRSTVNQDGRSAAHADTPAQRTTERGDAAGAGPGTLAPPVGFTGPPPAVAARSDRDDAGAGSSVAAPARRLAPSSTELARLHQQCESAAQRGDCPVVRQLVERITQADRGYRGRVAKDSAVAKCLAE